MKKVIHSQKSRRKIITVMWTRFKEGAEGMETGK